MVGKKPYATVNCELRLIFCVIILNLHTWSELLAPLVNMIKEGSENIPALLIPLIFLF